MRILKPKIASAVLAISLILAGCGDGAKSEATVAKAAPLSIGAVVASSKRAVNTVNVSGVVKATEQTVIASEVLKAELSLIEASLAKTIIKAPYSGTVGLR